MPGVEGSVVSSSNADSSGDGSSSSDPAAVVQSSIQTLVALARLYKGVAPKESLHVESFSEIADFLVRDTVQIPSARIGSIIWAVGVFKISKPQVSSNQSRIIPNSTHVVVYQLFSFSPLPPPIRWLMLSSTGSSQDKGSKETTWNSPLFLSLPRCTPSR